MTDRLLILTNSVDGTSDVLVRLLNHQNASFLRWNVDLWRDYRIRSTTQSTEIIDPQGRHVNLEDPELQLLWRKPFVEQMDFDEESVAAADQEAARVQMTQWLRSVVARMMHHDRVRLIEPYADQRLPKLFQLQESRHFFRVPQSLFSTHEDPEGFGPEVITKPLGNPQVGQENIFYTRRVSSGDLFRPYPWFVQEALIGGRDITCVYIHGRSYFYECEFARHADAIDWRTEINTPQQSAWHLIKDALTDAWSNSVRAYMQHCELHYGRLDFILHSDTLFFLECNSNGQFGWLDAGDSLYLHHAFLDAALDPTTLIGRRKTSQPESIDGSALRAPLG